MWGAYATILVEECVFDHNGWLLQNVPENKGRRGLAIPLSHNTYCTGMNSTIFRGNTFLRAASIGNKWTANQGPGSARNIVIDDNLYVDGEIGISMGGNQPGPLRWKNMRITNNVMLDIGKSRPTGRTLGWYVDATDWDGGLIANNLFLHQRSPDVRNVYAIHVGSSDAKGTYHGTGVHCRNVTVRDNIIHGLQSSGPVVRVGGGELPLDLLHLLVQVRSLCGDVMRHIGPGHGSQVPRTRHALDLLAHLIQDRGPHAESSQLLGEGRLVEAQNPQEPGHGRAVDQDGQEHHTGGGWSRAIYHVAMDRAQLFATLDEMGAE